MSNSFLITGGTGFIGRHLTAAIKARHGEAAVVSVGSSVDLRQQEKARQFFDVSAKFSHVIHLADQQSNMAHAATHTGEQFLANAQMTVNTLEAWSRFQPQARFVGFSSQLAYPAKNPVMREQEYWDGPMHEAMQHYGISKKLMGIGLSALKKQNDLKGTLLVLGNVYGPGDTNWHVIPSLIQRMKDNPNELEVWGDGSQERDFIFVKDQVEGILRHMDSDAELLNIGSGKTHSIRNVVETLARILPYHGTITYNTNKPSGVKLRAMEVSLASAQTGWPTDIKLHTLEEGLRETV